MIALATWEIVTLAIVLPIAIHLLLCLAGGMVGRRRAAPVCTPEPVNPPLVILVEGIRWLGVRWDLPLVQNGMRRAGIECEFLYWQWHALWRALLVLPTIMAPRLMEREAQRLADFLSQHRKLTPGRAIYLVGVSCGTHVTLRALELLPETTSVQAAALLSGAFSPHRDLTQACRHVEGNIVITSSWLDFLVLGLGTTLVGTGDRRFTPSAGMVGWRGRGGESGKITQIRWRPGMASVGYFGGHFITTGFVEQFVAPAMRGLRYFT